MGKTFDIAKKHSFVSRTVSELKIECFALPHSWLNNCLLLIVGKELDFTFFVKSDSNITSTFSVNSREPNTLSFGGNFVHTIERAEIYSPRSIFSDTVRYLRICLHPRNLHFLQYPCTFILVNILALLFSRRWLLDTLR